MNILAEYYLMDSEVGTESIDRSKHSANELRKSKV